MAASDVDTLMTAAAAAAAVSDWATAINSAVQAQLLLAAIPDAADGTGASMQWRAQSISDAIANIRLQRAGSLGAVQRQGVTYVTVTD